MKMRRLLAIAALCSATSCADGASQRSAQSAYDMIERGMTLSDVFGRIDTRPDDEARATINLSECPSTRNTFSIGYSEQDASYGLDEITNAQSHDSSRVSSVYSSRDSAIQALAKEPLRTCRKAAAVFGGQWRIVLALDPSGRVETISSPEF